MYLSLVEIRRLRMIKYATTALADRILGLVAPQSEALAACSGGYRLCTTAPCQGVSFLYKEYWCTYKPNCSDTCALTGNCC
jgi:hypothetical protein